MGDISLQMTTLKRETVELAVSMGHTMQPFNEYAGGAVNVSVCETCGRYVLAEIYPTGHDVRGSALMKKCAS